ncbi:BQ2448_5756 [Microbotryum intermedium]|uniref:Small nuclear ribonucleoprotein Sm D3 n=1 Tax=Microbotryum intermedium TaxID=269621 RepID=A0A238EZ43_9BASI|nr:BQ2448_5756 [Microbotryum intermedium]
MANIGIPTKLLHEALGHVITVELKTGQVYRGKLFEGESFAIPLLLFPAAIMAIMATIIVVVVVVVVVILVADDWFSTLMLDCPEDSLSISLTQVTVTHRDGRVTQLDQVYIRGSSIRFYVVPDMLSQAPMFKRVGPNALKGRGIGAARGRATIMRAQARRGRGTGGGSRPPIRR